MKKLLKDDSGAFLNELENGEPSKALFINSSTLKDLSDKTELYNLSPVEFTENGLYFDYDGIGNTPLHHAGAFYIQDPSAMATTACLEGLEFSTVADLCASPGGKSLSSYLMAKDEGFILSNEYSVSRCKTLVGNFERFGIKNAITTNFDMTVENELTKLYDGFFDLVIADAPCSGEGMFRKYPEQAIGDWSVSNVLLCAERQKLILENAQKLVKESGYLLYSTCTFSLEENEMQIADFLENHNEFSLIPVSEKVQSVTESGIFFDGCSCDDISLTRRFYPHISKGEGQFIALMKKNGKSENNGKSKYTSPLSKPSDTELCALKDFTKKALDSFDFSKVYKYNDNLIYCDFDCPVPKSKVFSCGVKLGNIEKNRFIPHHQFFKCFGHCFKTVLDFGEDSLEISKYLHGEGFDADAPDGWCVICCSGFILGAGKAVDGFIKNHYPKGLRTL